MTDKLCTKCDRTLLLDAFNRRSAAKDGRQRWCRECMTSRARTLRSDGRYRAYDQAYNRTEIGRERSRRSYSNHVDYYRDYTAQPERKAKQREHQRRYYAADPARGRARAAVSHALAAGKIAPQPCAAASCECSGRIEAHHHCGYAPEHWLDVVWLCRAHHEREHHPRSLASSASAAPSTSAHGNVGPTS